MLPEIKSESLSSEIQNISLLTILAIYPRMAENVAPYSARKATGIDLFHNYFHILGIDILINEQGEPMVLELNDRPSMKITFHLNRDRKRG